MNWFRISVVYRNWSCLYSMAICGLKIGRQSRKERIAVVQRIAEVISYAHAHGVIHRDLKPSNIILGNYGEVLLIDWGLALHISDHSNLERQNSKRFMEHPQYLDSEVARGLDWELVDIYGLGAPF